jgi:hypothetical protein
MNQAISQRFKPSESLSFISGNIADIMNNFRNITKQTVPVLFNDYSKYNDLLNKIDEFSKLLSNWDSYNANVISKIAIATAKKVLDNIKTTGFLSGEIEINVFPMRDGGIQFEFDGNNICAELEINQNGEMTFIQFSNDGGITKKLELFQLSELSTLLEEALYPYA